MSADQPTVDAARGSRRREPDDACQEWPATKTAYRVFSNERVSEADILGGQFVATRQRPAAGSGTVLVLQDTTAFSFQRESSDAIEYMT